MSLFRDKYRIESSRNQKWDYRSNGVYFITINTRHRRPYFGYIKNNQMILSDIGKIANQLWLSIPAHFSFAVLDAHVIMPDHMHGIIMIKSAFPRWIKKEPEPLVCSESDVIRDENMSRISPKKGSVSSIIRSYKGEVTKQARKINPSFKWQERYYDRILRDEKALYQVQLYIQNNPENWKKK